jgi:hypothetical protein
MKTLDEFIKEMGIENIKVVRICERNKEEFYAISRKEHDNFADEIGLPPITLEDERYKDRIKRMIEYVKSNGIKFEPTLENWKKLNYPLQCFYFWKRKK